MIIKNKCEVTIPVECIIEKLRPEGIPKEAKLNTYATTIINNGNYRDAKFGGLRLVFEWETHENID